MTCASSLAAKQQYCLYKGKLPSTLHISIVHLESLLSLCQVSENLLLDIIRAPPDEVGGAL